MVHVYEAKKYQGVLLSKVECPNVLKLFVLSPLLVVAPSQTTTMHRVNQGVNYAQSEPGSVLCWQQMPNNNSNKCSEVFYNNSILA